MSITKKIIIEKTDEPAVIAEKFLDAEAETVVLIVPKNSRLADSSATFKLLKRQAEVLRRALIIESVDESVLSLAKKVGLEAVNPLFDQERKVGEKKMSDIVVKTKKTKAEEIPKAVPIVVVSEAAEVVPIKAAAEEVIKKVSASRTAVSTQRRRGQALARLKRSVLGGWYFISGIRWRSAWRRRNLIIAGGIVVIGFFVYAALVVLPRAAVAITIKKEPWAYTDQVLIDKTISAIDSTGARVPGQLFTQKSNASLQFPATGKKAIERRATGKIIVYNALSNKPQPLVSSTRFSTPDGKIFRLDSSIIIPGAEIVDGKIVPSSVIATITADKPGAEYNVGPVAKLTIPGLSGTPKYTSFYGEIKDQTAGGFVGELKIATEADIKMAKAAANKAVESSVRALTLSQIPNNFKILDDATRFMITKQTVNAEADSTGKFSVFTEGQLVVLAFQEKDVLAMLAGRARADKGSDYQVKDLSLAYSPVTAADPTSGRLSIGVNYQAELSHSVDEPVLLQTMQGKSEEQLQTIISAIPGVASAEVTLWPFWVRTVPNSVSKITLRVQ